MDTTTYVGGIRGLSERELQIHRLADRRFIVAKWWWYGSMYSQFLVAAATGIGLVSTTPGIIFPSLLVVLGLQLFAWFCQSKTSDAKRQANQAHRTLHIMYGLDAGIHPEAIIELEAELGVKPSNGEKTEPKTLDDKADRSYLFCCAERPSHIALLRCLQETGYYLHKLYRKSASFFNILLALCAVIILLTLLTFLFLPSMLENNSQAPNPKVPAWLHTIPVITGKIVVVFLSFLVAVDFAGLAINYNSSSNSLLSIEVRIGKLCDDLTFDVHGNAQQNIPQIMAVLTDFYAAAEQAPLIPTFIHSWHRQHLTDTWKRKMQTHPIKSHPENCTDSKPT